MFSSRVPPNRETNRLARAAAHVRATRPGLIDLTTTNPTTAGFEYPDDLFEPLASPSALVYTPHPSGLEEAREAVARDYARRGISMDARRIILTASTSEAYSVLFKLLCGPGEAVLVPAPSYPLFDHLTRLDIVHTRAYHLEYHGRWTVDIGSVDTVWSEDVRAVLAVSPNNPTGSMLSPDELTQLDMRCAQRRSALILDEVFADYRLAVDCAAAPSIESGALTFRLGGLSKSAGLPQVKLGWIGVAGPGSIVDEALERLELICDTYLSVSTPVQVAASALIKAGANIRRQIRSRVTANYRELCRAARACQAVTALPADGGWSAVLRVPSTRPEEDLVLELMEHDDVIVHPGFFFDFPRETFLVLSLLPEPGRFAEGVRRLMERTGA